MMQHLSMHSPPTRLLPLGLGFLRSLAGAMWKSLACALSSRVSRDCVFLICFNVECLHHARYSGPVEAGSRVTQKTMLRFTWQLVAGEVRHSCEVHLLCHNAAKRGVHPPMEWKNGLNLGGVGLQALNNLADSAIQRARDEFALPESLKLDCKPRFTHARTPICGRSRLACVRACVRSCVCVCTWLFSHMTGTLDHPALS